MKDMVAGDHKLKAMVASCSRHYPEFCRQQTYVNGRVIDLFLNIF